MRLPPLVIHAKRSKRWYIAMRYQTVTTTRGVAYKLGPKHDVTDQIERILAVYGTSQKQPSASSLTSKSSVPTL